VSIFSLFEDFGDNVHFCIHIKTGVNIKYISGSWCQNLVYLRNLVSIFRLFEELCDNVHTLFEELGDDVVDEPLLCELQVVSVRGEERDTASVVQSLQTQLVLNIKHMT